MVKYPRHIQLNNFDLECNHENGFDLTKKNNIKYLFKANDENYLKLLEEYENNNLIYNSCLLVDKFIKSTNQIVQNLISSSETNQSKPDFYLNTKNDFLNLKKRNENIFRQELKTLQTSKLLNSFRIKNNFLKDKSVLSHSNKIKSKFKQVSDHSDINNILSFFERDFVLSPESWTFNARELLESKSFAKRIQENYLIEEKYNKFILYDKDDNDSLLKVIELIWFEEYVPFILIEDLNLTQM